MLTGAYRIRRNCAIPAPSADGNMRAGSKRRVALGCVASRLWGWMVALRHRPKGGRVAPFGLGILACALVPTQIGYQDLAALIARQTPVAERAPRPSNTVHAASFNMPRPIAVAMPAPLGYTLAGIDPTNADITGSIRERLRDPIFEPVPEMSAGLTIERRLKGARLDAGSRADPA